MIKIGLTGGIGSGKTTVASLLEVMGIPVYIADEESKKLTDSSPVIRQQLVDLFGKEIYTKSGLNRPLLASLIFNDPEHLKMVNAIIHPQVNSHFLNWATNQSTDLCAIETAILFESGFDRIVDTTLMVYAPVETRIGRASTRSNVKREDIVRRINNQMPDEIKRERSEYVIDNDGACALIPQLEKIITSIRSK